MATSRDPIPRNIYGHASGNSTGRRECAAKRIVVMFNITGGIGLVEIMFPPKRIKADPAGGGQ